jgi:hypothetical protein
VTEVKDNEMADVHPGMIIRIAEIISGVGLLPGRVIHEDAEASGEWLRATRAELIEWWDGGCDHSVNICKCAIAAVLDEIELVLTKQEVCFRCHGDGLIDGRADGMDVMFTCDRCEGKGRVPK